jgi:multidrug efflux system membrane fusion protein
MNARAKLILAAAGIALLGLLAWRTGFHQAESQPPGAADAAKPVPVTTELVKTADVPLYAGGVGAVQAYNTVTIQARVDGELESVDFREGQDVKAGDRLAQIDARPFQAALDSALAALARDEATLANAKRDLARYQDTAGKGYTTRQQLETQLATVGSLTAAIQGDQAAIENARIQLGYTTIVSPIDGRTGIRHIDKGNIVHAADAGGLVTITQLQPISAIFTLPQDILPAVVAAQAAGPPPVVAFARDNRTELGEGVLELVDNQIDPATGTIRLKARFANPGLTLWPGEFINARLRIGVARNGLTVDSRAVQRGPDGIFAYVVRPDDTVEMREVEIGQDYRGRTLVTKGLAVDEQVVVDGQLRLEPGSKVSTGTDRQPVRTGLATPAP